MDNRATVGILNELLALEQRSLAVRLLESTVFVSRLAVEDLKIVQQMAIAGRQHAAWLADVLQTHGSVPGPRIADAQSADLHFQELHQLLPRLVTDRRALIRKYELAANHLGANPDATGVVARILDQHRRELASLQQATGQAET